VTGDTVARIGAVQLGSTADTVGGISVLASSSIVVPVFVLSVSGGAVGINGAVAVATVSGRTQADYSGTAWSPAPSRSSPTRPTPSRRTPTTRRSRRCRSG
jgi:hypothetical protein